MHMPYANIAAAICSLILIGFLVGYVIGGAVASRSGAGKSNRDSKGRFTK